MTAPLSEHYVKATSVDPSEMHLQYGVKPLIGTAKKKGKPPVGTPKYELIKRDKKVVDITVDGSGKDGAMPWGTTWATDDIHWQIHFRLWADYDPLKPEIGFNGKHDSYPSYEIIVIQSDGTYKNILRDAPKPGELPGPKSLDEDNAIPVQSDGTDDPIE